jgi:LAS superfamily LD-carboxypeptidase LdcB
MLTVRRRRHRASRRWAALVAIGALAAVANAGTAPSGAQEAEQEQLRQRQVEVASQVDILRADASEVEAALTTLSENVAVQSARLDDAKRTVHVTQQQIAETTKRQQEEEAKIAELQGQLREIALAAYVRPPADELALAMSDDSPTLAAKRKVLANARALRAEDVLDQLRSTKQDLANARAASERALADAEAAQQAEESRLQDAQNALDSQSRAADDVQVRLDSALSEAAAISARSQQLADEITAREQALARKAASRSSSGSGGRPAWVSSGVSVTTVRGIEVATSIADQLDRMLEAAEADGVYLSGSGFRDIQTQIALREEHCGTSEYAIWQMDSGSCSPPVARPGYSMHEQGLAIDFVLDGDLIRSRYSSAFEWLSDNAADYGFYNLPSEPWHWSVNGR